MPVYVCPGFRAVRADDISDAARTFANRAARQEFGRAGYARTLRLDTWTRDESSFAYQAFIGRDTSQNTCTGHNIWLHISRRREG